MIGKTKRWEHREEREDGEVGEGRYERDDY